MTMRATCSLGLITLLAACGGGDGNSGNDVGENSTPAVQSAGRDSLLAVLDADSVRLRIEPRANVIEWTSMAGGQEVLRWRSRPLLDAIPSVDLRRIDGDTIPDLVWAIQYEEMVGGMVVLGRAQAAKEAFATRNEVCRGPELRDVNADGRLDVLEYLPGAFTFDQCANEATLQSCRARYPTDWVVAWLQRDSGFVNEPSLARDFYAAQETAFVAAARALRSQRAPAQPGCDAALANALDSLGREARRLASGAGAVPGGG